MEIIPLTAFPNQKITVGLAGQTCQIQIRQSSYGLFATIKVNDALIVAGVRCLNQTKIVRDAYLGFVGDLAFVDTQGEDDPIYTGLGGRFRLVYLTPAEAAA